MKYSSFNKALDLLGIIEREEDIDVKRIYKRNPDLIDVLEILLELELVSLEDGEIVLTDKGKNVFYYFNKHNQDNTPLIRVK